MVPARLTAWPRSQWLPQFSRSRRSTRFNETLRRAGEKPATNICKEGQMRQLLRFFAAFALASTTAWAGGGPPLQVKVHGSPYGDILADEAGMTLYTFDGDARYRARCSADCAADWRPFAAPESCESGGYWAPLTRSDGFKQWTYGGKPLYTYRGDMHPGDINGERHDNGRWHAARVLCLPVDAEGYPREAPVIGVVDSALEAGASPLREVRRWCGVELGELAERSGIDVTALAAYEGGRGDLAANERAAVAIALGIPVYLLLTE
jgi:predicted lipoprotein with Yx(FWY)xxD motif